MNVEKEYKEIATLFLQKDLALSVVAKSIKLDDRTLHAVGFLAWRYLFCGDISKRKLISSLTKLGYTNLEVSCVMDSLYNSKKVFNEILNVEKNHKKKRSHKNGA